MTDALLPVVDELPLTALPDRYGVARSQIYNRIKALGIETVKRDNRAYVGAAQIAQLDQIHQLIGQGRRLEDAAAEVRQDNPVRQSHETPGQYNADPLRDGLVRQSYEVAGQADLLQLLSAISSQQALPPANPLQRFEQLQAMADHDWRPSTRELAEILGLQSLSGAQFERYGFRFTRAGRNGAQSAWRIEKL
ncbi:MAG TPA: hypothetical protein V6D29_25405 [Leptolyngbyaceae cyanobacterium]